MIDIRAEAIDHHLFVSSLILPNRFVCYDIRSLLGMNGANIKLREMEQHTPVSSRLIKALRLENFKSVITQLAENRRNYKQPHATSTTHDNIVQNPHRVLSDKEAQDIRTSEMPHNIVVQLHIIHSHVFFSIFFIPRNTHGKP